MNPKMTRLAMESITGKPSLAPAIPINAPMEEKASERWCQASAINAPESIFRAWITVYQYIASLLMMDTIAAARANLPGICRVR